VSRPLQCLVIRINGCLMRDFILKVRILYISLIGAYEEWKSAIWERDLDENFCCDGRECGCGGDSVREAWDMSRKY